MKSFICMLTCLFLFSSVSLFAQSKVSIKPIKTITEQEKIDFLIKSIEDLKGAKFWRNGTYYDAKSAASHLRMKRDKAGNSVKTARDFIDKIATKSSVSGEYYRIKFESGKEIETRVFLNEKLKEIENN